LAHYNKGSNVRCAELKGRLRGAVREVDRKLDTARRRHRPRLLPRNLWNRPRDPWTARGETIG
jgi:hypothetical protein